MKKIYVLNIKLMKSAPEPYKDTDFSFLTEKEISEWHIWNYENSKVDIIW